MYTVFNYLLGTKNTWKETKRQRLKQKMMPWNFYRDSLILLVIQWMSLMCKEPSEPCHYSVDKVVSTQVVYHCFKPAQHPLHAPTYVPILPVPDT